MNSVSVIVMAYDEAASLDPVVVEIASELASLNLDHEIVIIDDGSKDGTRKLADDLAIRIPKVRVIHHPGNRGLGGVYRTGFEEAKLEYVTFFPGDGQVPASVIGELVSKMRQADFVLGYMPNRHGALIRRFLSWAERVFYRLLFGGFPRFQGVLMFRKEMLNRFPLVSTGRGWAIVMELILRARDGGFRYINAPIDMRPRQSGHSKVSNLRTIFSNFLQMLELRKKMKGK